MNKLKERKVFGILPDGREIEEYELQNNRGLTVRIINYGAIITSLEVPDRDGKCEDIVLGFDNLEDYLKDHPYLGAVIGRYGNRIAGGTFTLDDHRYELAKNLGQHHLHGGNEGFDKKVWSGEWLNGENGVRLTYTSPHLEEGYPGRLTLTVEYLLTDRNELKIRYEAHTDAPTVLNPTQHTYFNLNGMNRDIHDHRVRFAASRFLQANEDLIPTGTLLPVKGTPFDFSDETPVGARIDDTHIQLIRAGGYDHCYVIDREDPGLVYAANVYDPDSGRNMSVYTTEPAFQFYTSNSMDSRLSGKGKKYGHRMGLCIETQHFPDSPNQPEFPSTRLDPGNIFKSETHYVFSVRDDLSS